MNILTNSNAYLANPAAFDEVYERGAFEDGYRQMFLGPGMAENWKTLNAKLNRLPAGVRVGFRIIDFKNVPAGWPTVTVGGSQYPDFQSAKVREEYPRMLRNFKATVPRVTWLDIPFPYSGSNEPSITEAQADALPGGRARYFADCKWIIDQYVEVFGRALVGNFCAPSWIAKELLPYMKAKGIRAYRQDAFMRFKWHPDINIEGENRATCYDSSVAILGGRDTFDRAIFEQTGNGLTADGRDQTYKTLAPIEQMFGKGGAWGGQYYQLEGTDYFNMGLPGRQWVHGTVMALKHLEDWYDYIGVLEPGPVPVPDPEPVPGDGGGPDPVPAEYLFPVEVRGGQVERVVYGGQFDPIELPDYAGGADFVSHHLIPIPIVNGKRWNPRVYPRSLTGSDAWTITPAEPSDNDEPDNFHCEGRPAAVVTFEGYEPEPIPDPTPDPQEYVTREEFADFKIRYIETINRVVSDIEGKADKGDYTVRLG